MIKVVGQALGEFRNDLLEEVEKIIAEQVGQLRADVDPNRDSDDGEVLLLPNPLQRRSGRAQAAAAEISIHLFAPIVAHFLPRSAD